MKQFNQIIFCISLIICSISDFYGQIAFEKNEGQLHSEVAHFKARLSAGDVHFTKNSFVYRLYKPSDLEKIHEAQHTKTPLNEVVLNAHVYKANFLNTNSNVKVIGADKHTYHYNYFKDNNPNNWATDVPLFKKLRYENLYNNINVEVYENEGNFKYDYIVKPGGNPNDIQLSFEDAELSLVQNQLVITTSVGEIKELKPYSYQIINGEKTQVECKYKLNGNTVSFKFANSYNKNETLIIDPTVVFVSYTGSSADNWGFTATPDNLGNMFTGGSVSALFTGTYPTNSGAFQTTYRGGDADAAISKFSADGSTLLYSTYLGGSSTDLPHSLIVDSDNNLIVYGSTGSFNFPTSPSCYDNTFNGGSSVNNNGYSYINGSDIFILKFNNTGSNIIGSTFLGGTSNDGLNLSSAFNFYLNHNYGDASRGEVYVDDSDNIYIASCTQSSNFPTTAGAFSTSYGGGSMDGCAAKFNSNLSTLLWSSYVGGSKDDACYSLKVAQNGKAYLAGGTSSTNFQTTQGALKTSYQGGRTDGFVVGLNTNNGSLYKSTYLGTNAYDQAYFVELDENNNIYILGQSEGNYPVTNAGFSNPGSAQFIHKLTEQLNSTVFSTVFGDGSNFEVDISPSAFMVDRCERIYVSGWGGFNTSVGSSSTYGLQTTPDAFKSNTDGEDFYFMVVEKDATNLLFGSYFGGNGPTGEHVDGGTSRFDREGRIYQAVCAGCSGSNAFPTTPGVVSTTNGSSNCNLGAIKIEFDLSPVFAMADANPNAFSCQVPFEVNFVSSSTNVISHQWDFDFNGSTSTAANPSFTYTEAGVYNVQYIAENANACNKLDTTELEIVVDPPPPPVFDFTYTTNCDDQSVAAMADNDTINYIWLTSDGNSFANSADLNYTFGILGNHTLTLVGTHPTCFVSDTVTKQLTFAPYFEASLIPSPAYGCAPLNVDFNGYSDGISYEMDFGDGTLDTNTNINFNHTYTTPGAFTAQIIITDTGFCNTLDTATVDILVESNEQITANFTAEVNCDNLSVEFTNQTAPKKQFAVYNWNFGNGTTGNQADSIFTVSYGEYDIFTVNLLVEDTFCNNTDNATQIVKMHLVNAEMEPSPSFGCKPLPVTFNNLSTNAVSYEWELGETGSNSTETTPTHTYLDGGRFNVTLAAIDSSSCNIVDYAYDSILVGDALPVNVNFTAFQNTNCGLHLFDISANSTGEVGSYEWNFGDGNSQITYGNGSAENISEFQYSYENPGNYTITLTGDDTLCGLQDVISIPVLVRPGIPLSLTGAEFLCQNETITIDTQLPSNDYSFNWSTGETTNTIIVDMVGSYAVSVTDGYCLASQRKEVKSPEFYDLGGSLQQCFIDEAVNLDIGIEGKSYLWESGSKSRNISTNKPGIYKFTVIDKYGCTYNEQFEVVEAKSSYDVWIPNTFTPNNDKLNEEFKPKGIGLIEYKFQIFNRWGDKVFESENLDKGWSGRTNTGEILPLGVYSYKVSYTNYCTRANGHTKHGFVVLAR